MESDRDKTFKNRCGWLYEDDPLLARPAAALGILNTLTDRDTEILV
jgi:hypothetical protein